MSLFEQLNAKGVWGSGHFGMSNWGQSVNFWTNSREGIEPIIEEVYY